ncbi:ribosome maturation factor RimP [Corynebacterium hansenii]|uniref:Ribosome maturation factor RimP n=1 Tax=Corynebacterium hansenii TaxID=394964 RepID=A0ABV7ZTM2_9CORY|nr:ribosome maturation factor RimP [Corynebacterium hansenii]WJY99766.1 ribosome maturation protein RimP [Corynebacterium hansenii]
MAFPPAESIAGVIRPAAAARGLDIEDVKVAGAGRKTQVTVLVDGDEAPDLDAIEAVTRDISAALDEAEAAGEIRFGELEYTLEVSTPGVAAPLVAPRHWRRNRNRLVRIRLDDGGQLVGRIGAYDEDGDRVIIVASTGPKGRPKATGAVLELASVEHAVVEIEFSKAPAVELDLAGLDFDDAVTRLEELDK